MKFYIPVSLIEGEAKDGGVHNSQLLIEGGCSCWLVFNKKRVLIEGGMHVSSFSIEKEC